MEEFNILEAGAPERALPFYTIVKIFCVLLLMVLLLDPGPARSAENFFDLLLVPIAETGNAVYGKYDRNMLEMQGTTKSILKELDLKHPAIPYPDEPCLLTEVATTGQSLMLENSFNQNDGYTEDAGSFPVLAMVDGSSVKDTVSDSILQDPIVSEHPAELNTQISPEQTLDSEDQPVSRLPSDIQDASEAAASNIEQDSTQVSIADPTIQEPLVQEPLPDGPQTSSGNIADSVVSEEPPNPFTPELTEPDPTISDVTDPSEIETGTDDDTTEETTSCFLIDEAGMLFGFLPEYAGMQDGYLMLPEECTGIRSGAFSGTGAQIAELYIPAGVMMIEEGAFIGLDSLTYIDVDSANPVYTNISGVLFDSTATVLLSFPAGRIGTYLLPAQVTQIGNGAFTNTSLSHLDFRRCSSLFFGENIFGPSSGNGIVIAVPAESLPVYEELLCTYAVTLTI